MLSIGYAVGRIGCFLVGDDYGRPTDSWVGLAFPNGTPPSTAGNLRHSFGVDVPDSVPDWEVLRVHPTQLYETAIMLVVFVILWRLRRHPHRAGWLFMLYLVLAGLERAFVEIFRAKDQLRHYRGGCLWALDVVG
jgi:phosphatidylglycerol:prolipoprotein diacylglycerol transferase